MRYEHDESCDRCGYVDCSDDGALVPQIDLKLVLSMLVHRLR